MWSFKIKIQDWLLIALFFISWQVMFVSSPVWRILKVFIVIGSFIYLFSKTSVRKFKSWTTIFVAVIIIATVIGFINKYIDSRSVVDGVLYALNLFDLFLLAIYVEKKRQIQRYFDTLFWIGLVYAFLSIASIFMLNKSEQGGKTYLFGSKFVTCYLLFFFVSLVLTRYGHKMKHMKVYALICCLLLGIVAFISLQIDSTTGVVAAGIMVVFILAPGKMQKWFGNSKALVMTLLVMAVVPVVFQSVLSFGFVQHFISRFDETSSINGRLRIYQKLFEIINNRPLLGYGYGNTIVSQIVSFGNAQNGMLNFAINYGFLGVLSFLACSASVLHKVIINERYLPLLSFVYMMIFCSSIEVSFNNLFFISLYTLMICGRQEEIKHG